MMKKKFIGSFEIWLLLIGIVAFAYFIGDLPSVNASEFFPTGCCVEDDFGGICQDMLMIDSDACSSGLIASNCQQVSECQPGCCYSPQQGGCTLNAPKGQCLANGGNWSSEADCNIPQCNLGCCILGEEAALKTNRECTLLSREFKIEKEFKPLDSDGSCDSYAGLSQDGACVRDLGDGSGEKECSRTTKGDCSNDFYSGMLCSAPELNTLCLSSTQTTCVDGRDEIYYVDSCGNQANIYDSSKVDDMNYWTKIISPKASCQEDDADCGNCDYLTGSRCYKRKAGDANPTYGDNVCRDLSCDNGRQHGESWCVYDYDVSKLGVAPVGSRNFVADCIEGEVSIRGCADFNQEICVENPAEGFSEAACVTNDWRSCLNVNEEADYTDIEPECNDLGQCMMVNDRIGEENLKRSDGEFLAGFNPEIINEEQGATEDVGEGINIIIPHCVPKYTPGFQFWSSDEGGSYGGSSEESSAICSLGGFTCISKKSRKCTLAGGCTKWSDNENWECNIEGRAESIETEDLPKLIDSLTERCASLGSCGVNINLEGKAKTENQIQTSRIKINKKGATRTLSNDSAYQVSESYVANLLSKAGLIKLGSLEEIPFGNEEVIDFSSVSGGEILGSSASDIGSLEAQAKGEFGTQNALGAQVFIGGTLLLFGSSIITLVAAAGYTLGMMIGKNAGMSPGKQKSFVNVMAAGGAALTAGGILGIAIVKTSATLGIGIGATLGGTLGGAFGGGAFASTGAIIASVLVYFIILAILYIIYEAFINQFEEQEFYISQYQCGAWEPPTGGECSLCNDDARPCSEYRCKSLGSNCDYYTDLGEPGHCADAKKDIWSADIKPWEEALTEGHKYTEEIERGFRIEQESEKEIEAWLPIQFGITTNKPAICRLDTKHTETYDEMQYSMINVEYDKHSISLSPHVNKNSSSAATPGIDEGENRYYIRCKNFAGAINEAEHVVILDAKGGPDLTAPIISLFSIDNNAYLAKDTNSSEIVIYVNEPAKCKFSKSVDLNYDVMANEMSCITHPEMGYYGSWSCSAELDKLAVGENKYFFKCKDQPDLNETIIRKRNVNQQSTPFSLNVCSTGLDITSLEPKNTVIGGKSPVETTITAETSGCVDNGVAECSYKFESDAYSSGFVPFYETDSRSHSQVFSTIVAGDYNITVECIDPAGNKDKESIYADIEIDNNVPNVVRAYDLNNLLTIITNEESSCVYNADKNVKCEFEFEEGIPMDVSSDGEEHTTAWIKNKEYYVKCKDIYGNQRGGCDISVKTY